MRPATRIARWTSLFAASAIVFAVLAVVSPRGRLTSAFAAAAPQETKRLSFHTQFPAAALGKPYMQSMRASGGGGGYTFAEGDAPPGMQWVPAGEGLVLRGTPTQAGDYPLRIIVTDAAGQQITKDDYLHVTPNDNGATVPIVVTDTITTTDAETISSPNPIAITPSSIPAGQAGATYAGVTFTATGGLGTLTIASSSAIPNGMNFTQGSGKLVLSGFPTQSGAFPLVITASDSAGESASKAYTLNIASAAPLVISPASIPNAQLYVPYAGATITASGGIGTITVYSLSDLPNGITFLQNGGSDVVLAGTPTQSGTFPVVVAAVDSVGDLVHTSYVLTVGPAPALAVYPATIPSSITVGNIYTNQTFQGSGGSGASTIALTAGSVPPGLTLTYLGQNSAAVLFGTATKPGNYTFTFTATDTKTNATASQTYTITVNMPEYSITPGSFAKAVSGTSYSQTFSIVGNPAGYTLTMTNAGGLPPGLTYTASGETVSVAGTPANITAVTLYGPFIFNLTDAYGNVQALAPLGLIVEPAPAVTITPTISPAAPIYTDQITLNYAVAGNYTEAPSGSIAATLDGSSLPTVAVANYAASLKLGTLAPGTHTLAYSYTGDSFYPPTSTSNSMANASGKLIYTFTVAYPPYYLTGTAFLLPVTGNYDAIDASDNVYIADTGNNVIRKYDTSGNVTVVPTTGLNQPRGMVFDGSGNLYIADSQNNRIVELAPGGTQAVLPMGTVTLSYPSALAIDATSQNLWIVDQNNGRVLDYNLPGQTVVAANTVTGFGNAPVSVAVAKDGTVYAGTQDSYGPGAFYTFTPGSTQPTRLPNLPFNGVYSLAFDRTGTLYIFAANALFRLGANSTTTQVASQLSDNTEMAINSQGTILLTDQSYGDLAAFTPGPAGNAGLSVSSEGYTGTPPGGGFSMYFHSPAGTTLTAIGVPANSAYTRPSVNATDGFASIGMSRGPFYPGLQRSSVTATFSDGTLLQVPLYGSAYNTELGVSPGVVSQIATNAFNSTTTFGGITVDQNSNVYFTDTAANKVYEVFEGIVTPIGFTTLSAPTQVAVDGSGDVYELDSGTSRILKYNNTATHANDTTTVAFDLSAQSALATLTAFALDGAGNLYLAGANNNGQGNSYGNGRIQKLSSLGAYSNFSSGLVAVPTALALDGNSMLYSGDATGLVTEFNRFGAPGALATVVGAITSLAIEPSGTVYATTAGSGVLSSVSPQGTVSSHGIAGVTAAVAVAEDGAGTLTVADGTSGNLFTEVRDAYLLYSYSNQGTATNLNFPATVVGSVSPVQSYTLSNTGTTEDAYGFNGLSLTGLPNLTDFPQAAATTCTGSTDLAAGASCVLAYTFHPAAQGYDSEGAAIAYSTTHPYNAYSTTVYPTFTGTGISQYANISFSVSSIQFGNVGIGVSATQTLTVTNIGAATLHLTSISVNQAVYSYTTNCGAAVAPKASCTISVVFTPAYPGEQGAMMFLVDDSGGNPGNGQEIYLDGTGFVRVPPFVFVADGAGSVSSLYSDGSAQSGAVAGGGIGAAVDRNGLVFSITADGTGVSTFSDSGTLTNTTTGVLTGAAALAIDGGDQLWIASPGSVSVGQILGQGTVSVADPTLLQPSGIAIDLSGNVWITDRQTSTVHEIVGGAAPVAPLAKAVQNNTLGVEP